MIATNPVHVHAERDRETCKFWLDPVELVANFDFTSRDLSAVRRIIFEYRYVFWRLGMSTATHPTNDPRVRKVEVTDDLITAHLADGRTISVPLAWSWRLSEAAPADRAHFEIVGDGSGNT